MATVPLSPTLRVSKKSLSMFLRTKCDKELFLSLHDARTMARSDLPQPIKRPGIGTLSLEGERFEQARNDQLVALFPGLIHFSKSKKGDYEDVDLLAGLTPALHVPRLILQGAFEIAPAFQPTVLARIGLSAGDIASVPPLAGFVPDLIYVRAAHSSDLEICPDGTRRAIDSSTETRLALSIIDIKHTSEANPSYRSEIAMYALMLVNWIEQQPALRGRYFVSTNALLWTRYKQGDSALDRLQSQGGASTQQLLDALVADGEEAQLQFYLAAIRRFFEDVARVVRTGTARAQGWRDLDWHVAGSCGSCDWLGDKRHMGKDGQNQVDVHPDHYCMPLAEAGGHLCLVPGITRAARSVLGQHTVNDTAALAAASGHVAFQHHTLLKREAKTLPLRSAAINSGTLSRDPNGAIASLARSAHLLVYASVNFDSSSGLLTGLALSATATAFTQGQAPRRFRPVPFIVDQKTLNAEWDALQGFLTQIADYIDAAESMVSGALTGQIHFWEQRQFQELCNAMGRHLPRVMTLAARKAKALAWVFPADEMIGTKEALEASAIVAVDDIVRRLIFAPTRHVITLFDTVEHYRSGPSPATRDSYYREYLSNGIPRERIYEIWSNAATIKRGQNVQIPRNTAIATYADALTAQARALEAVCEKLRVDYRDQFRASTARIPVSIPRGAMGVAFDSKLWLWWDELDFAAGQVEAHIKLSTDGERLEATYEAIVLHNGVDLGGGLYQFDVAPGSTEAKFKEESRLTLGKIGLPGLPLQKATSLISSSAPAYSGNADLLQRPLWSVLTAKLVDFNRVARQAVVELSAYNEPAFVSYLLTNATVPLLDNVFLVENKSPSAFNWARRSGPILTEIGDPHIATADPNAARAMNITPAAPRRPRSPETPAARVLWNAPAVEQRVIVAPAIAGPLAARVGAADGLNNSQQLAVAHAIERALTVIWGPPGTGKTKTLAAMLHAMIVDAAANRRPLRLLVVGPTYKAVDETILRTIDFLNRDTAAACTIYQGYSIGRDVTPAPVGIGIHVNYRTMHFDSNDTDYVDCCSDVSGPGVTLVSCIARQAWRFGEMRGGRVADVFEVVVIDESSQVPVSQALGALSALRDDARLIVAGDHLQMPPIASLESPPDASYVVGSVQTYLSKRTFSQPMPQQVLERNYRSNQHVVDFAKTIGYPTALTAAYPMTALHYLHALPTAAAYPAALPWSDAFAQLLYPDTKVATLLHEDATSSQANRFEAQMVAGLVWMLRQSVSAQLDGRNATATHRAPSAEEFWKSSVGIVTPHRAQRALVVQELEHLFPTEANLINDAVDTVERFQGGERHAIFVTFGVADVDVIQGEEAFLLQLERTNVAVSRAMAKCVVIMPFSLAAHIPEDKRALQTAHALKGYVDEFCNARVDTTVSIGPISRRAQLRYRT